MIKTIIIINNRIKERGGQIVYNLLHAMRWEELVSLSQISASHLVLKLAPALDLNLNHALEP